MAHEALGHFLDLSAEAIDCRNRLLPSTINLPAFLALVQALDQNISGNAQVAWNEAAARVGVEYRSRLGASIMAHFVSTVPDRLSRNPLPDSVLPGLVDQLRRILCDADLPQVRMHTLDQDIYRKDLAIVRLRVLPCGAQIVEPASGISRILLLRRILSHPGAITSFAARTRFRCRPVFELHTHTPMLSAFTPEGWRKCYLMAADLFRCYPDHEAVVGGAWFFDPALCSISPRLKYLREVPLAGGAWFIKIDSRARDIANATALSAKRQMLYEQGRYLPTGWVMIWPRDALCAWAKGEPA